ncbi:MAG: DMT family transporter [Gammaproteobacteria bacterium]|nr:DMT family transporter [Gammaproteobacteria bacterium]
MTTTAIARPWLGFFLAFLGTALFSFKSIFIKLAYAEGLNTDSVLMLRMLMSLPIYLAIIGYLWRQPDAPKSAIREHAWFIIFLGFIGYFLSSWLDLKGLEYITAGLERLTLFTYPIFVTLLGALFFKTPLNRHIVITLVLTYSGIWMIFSQEAAGDNSAETKLGVLLVALSALSYSFYVLFGKGVIHKLGSTWFTALAMSVSSVFVLAYYGVTLDFSQLVISPAAWFWVACLALVSTVIPSFMISESIARIGSAQTGIVGTLGPVITILLAIVILGEPFTLYHLAGIALVMTGVLLLTLRKPEQKTS